MNYNLHLNPGPMDSSLLYLGDEHRARKLFLNPQAGDVNTIDFKRGDGTLWAYINEERISISGRVGNFISMLGFGGLVSCGKGRKIDRPLVETLVERWRPETNTFHLPFGEATVTLEDVNVLWGLPIEGLAIAPVEESYSPADRVHMCQTYLGFTPDEDDLKNHTLKIGKIQEFLLENPIHEHSTDLLCMQHARCICLILITNNLLVDTNKSYASLHVLNHLRDFNTCGQMSWGSAALAFLYRELTKGTKPETRALGGPMSLLQIWAWTRIRPMAPTIINEQIDWEKAYGAR
ncbi:serine/threonine-protein phosphatase 7 long form homolog [Bidens hawaiensis]|uniref:serine/threonine-protein phosphatase 7 long form homolog n=1 Tax=Bidens hawaiensis TaxID=980011 RepID=UPI00404AD8D3